jgi:H+/Cl- antiporter ClcA
MKTLLAKTTGLLLSISSGMPIGSEGPFIHITCILSKQIMRLPPFRNINDNSINVQRVMAAASAVGVAASFGAPIGGVLFSMEATSQFYLGSTYYSAFYCAIVGATVFWGTGLLADHEKARLFSTSFDEIHKSSAAKYNYDLVCFLLLGCLCGVFGAGFVRLFRLIVDTRRKYQRLFIKRPTLLLSNLFFTLFVAIGFGTLEYGLWITKAWKITLREAIDDLFCVDSPHNHTQPIGHSSLAGFGNSSSTNWASNSSGTNWTSGAEGLGDAMGEESYCQIRGSRWQKPGLIFNLSGFFLLKAFSSAVAVTLPFPCGVITSTFAIGASFGRLFGEIIKMTAGPALAPLIIPGGYAVVGAAAMTAQVTGCLSIAVITFELTGQLHLAVPVLLGAMAALAVGSVVGNSFFHEVAKLKKLPIRPVLRNQSETLLKANDVMRADLLLFLDRHATFKEIATVVALARQVHSLEKKTGSYRMNSISSPSPSPIQSPSSTPGQSSSSTSSNSPLMKLKISTPRMWGMKKKKDRVANANLQKQSLKQTMQRTRTMSGGGMRAYIQRRKSQGAAAVSHAGVAFENVLVPVVNTGDDMIFMGCCRVSDLEDLLTRWREEGNKPTSPRPEMFQADPGTGGKKAPFAMSGKGGGGKRSSFDMSGGKAPSLVRGGSVIKTRLRRAPSLASLIQEDLVVTHSLAKYGASPNGYEPKVVQPQMLSLSTPVGRKPPKLSRPSLDKLKKFGFDVAALVAAVESEYNKDAWPTVSPEQETNGQLPHGDNAGRIGGAVGSRGGGGRSTVTVPAAAIRGGGIGSSSNHPPAVIETYAEGEVVEATLVTSNSGVYTVAIITRVHVMRATGETVYDLVHENGKTQQDIPSRYIRRQPESLLPAAPSPPTVPPVVPPKPHASKQQHSGDAAIMQSIAAANNGAAVLSLTDGAGSTSRVAILRVKAGKAHRAESIDGNNATGSTPSSPPGTPPPPAPVANTPVTPKITPPVWMGVSTVVPSTSTPPVVPPMPRPGRMSIPVSPSLRAAFASNDSNASDASTTSSDDGTESHVATYKINQKFEIRLRREADHKSTLTGATLHGGWIFQTTERKLVRDGRPCGGDQVFLRLAPESDIKSVGRRNSAPPMKGVQWAFMYHPTSGSADAICEELAKPQLPPKPQDVKQEAEVVNGDSHLAEEQPTGSFICRAPGCSRSFKSASGLQNHAEFHRRFPERRVQVDEANGQDGHQKGGVNGQAIESDRTSEPMKMPLQQWAKRSQSPDGAGGITIAGASDSDSDSSVGDQSGDDVVVVVEEDNGEEGGGGTSKILGRLSSKSRKSLDDALGPDEPPIALCHRRRRDTSVTTDLRKHGEKYDLLKLLRTRDDFNHPNVTRETPLPHIFFLFHAHRCSRIFICEKVRWQLDHNDEVD